MKIEAILGLYISLKAWPNARKISTQHLATLLHDVATCVERVGQTHATFLTFSTQHVEVSSEAMILAVMNAIFAIA